MTISIDKEFMFAYTLLAITKLLEKKDVEALPYLEKPRKTTKNDFFLMTAESLLLANNNDPKALDINVNAFSLVRLRRYPEAVKEISKFIEAQYPFIRDDKFYDPLRNRSDFKKVLQKGLESYERNLKKFPFAL